MPITVSAKKRVRQHIRRAVRNRPVRTQLTNALRGAREAIEDGDAAAADAVREAQSALDSAVRHNIIHRNSASRRKSRLVKALKAMQDAS